MQRALTLVGVLALLGAPARAKDTLIPADFAAQKDARSYVWDLTPQGYINNGTQYAFNRAMVLTVNGAEFRPAQSQMTPDKHTFVFTGAVPGGIEVERQAKLDLDRGCVRFVDAITNTERKPITVTIKLYTRLSRSCDALTSDAGRGAEDGRVTDKEHGLFAYYRSREPSILFCLAGPDGARPQVQILSRRTLHFTWVITVPPRRSRAIVTMLGQVKLEKEPDPKLGEAFFGPLLQSDYLADVPAKYRRVVVNFDDVEDEDGQGEALLAGVLDYAARHEVKRDQQDTVIVDDTETMLGAVKGGQVQVKTAFGQVNVPFEELVFWRGGSGVGYPMLVAARNGEMFAGDASCADLRLATQTGVELPLAPGGFTALVMRKGSAPEPSPVPDAKALLKTHDGSLLLLRELSGAFKGLTPWGALDVDLREVAELRYGQKGYPGLSVVLRDGTRLPIVPAGDALKLTTLRQGAIDVPLHSIADLRRLKLKAKALRKGDEVEAAHVNLTGNAVLVGTLDLPELELITKTGRSKIKREQILSLTQLEGEGAEPQFELRLHSKERFEGRLALARLPIQTARARREVPAADLAELWQPPPPKEEKPEPEDKPGDEQRDEKKKEDF
ncbi:MAG: hypothetical protein AB7N76_14065 [Planctomycetota bacterium]